MRDKIIRINWHTAMPFEVACRSELAQRTGLYYITRVHGEKESSLYLGIARLNNTINHRLKSHQNNWMPLYRGAFWVRIGEIIYPKENDMEKEAEILYHAESALLYDPAHKKLFPVNISQRKSYSYSELYRVENIGDYFELKSSVRMHEQE